MDGGAAADEAAWRDRVAGALLGTFAGDAVGAPWEGAGAVAGRTAAERIGWLPSSTTLTYTDDTQMALALASHLLDHPDVEPDALAATFLAHHEEHRGYGAGMRTVVAQWRDGVELGAAATSAFADGSHGNGAAMRVAPVGVRHPDDAARREDAARRQAMVTHVHPVGIDAAVVQADAVALAARSGGFGATDVAALAERARTRQFGDAVTLAAVWVGRWHDDESLVLADVADALGTQVLAERSVPTALWCAAVADDLPSAVELALGLGGDADTIAAMAGAVHGAAGGLHAVPHDWLLRLEDGPRGLTWALDLAGRLAYATD